MICEKCGANNRDGARFCDSCGAPLAGVLWTRPDSDGIDALVDGEERSDRPVGSRGLVGWMAMDWTIRFMLAGIFGILLGLFMIGLGEYGFSVVFFGIAAIGILGTWYMARAKL